MCKLYDCSTPFECSAIKKTVKFLVLFYLSVVFVLRFLLCFSEEYIQQPLAIREAGDGFYCKGPLKRFQHLLQHAFNTVVEPNVGDV